MYELLEILNAISDRPKSTIAVILAFIISVVIYNIWF